MWRQRVPEPGRELKEFRYVSNLTRKQLFQKLILYQESGVLLVGQFLGEGGLSGRHLAAEEDQLR